MAQSLVELQQMLAEAQAAKHRRMIGSSVEEIRNADGSSVKFAQLSDVQLDSYISELQASIGQQTGVPRRGPILFAF